MGNLAILKMTIKAIRKVKTSTNTICGIDFSVKLEPIVELKTNSIVGYEALSSPVSKLGDVEGFFRKISSQDIFKNMVTQLELYGEMIINKKIPAASSKLFVNARRDVIDDVDFIKKILPYTDGVSLAIEIDAIPEPLSESAIENIKRLGQLGVDVWMDDYSGKEFIDRAVWSGIKLDKNFFWKCYNQKNKALSPNLLETKHIKKNNIVEGIETESQRDYAIRQGFTYGQGFLWMSDFIRLAS